MKATLLFGMLVSALGAYSQSYEIPGKGTNGIRLADSSYTWVKGGVNDSWQLSHKMVWEYNNNNSVSKDVLWIYSPPANWQNIYETSYTYNNQGYQTSALTKNYGVNSLLIESEYDDADNLIRIVLNDWNGTSWEQVTVQNLEYADNKLITHKYIYMPEAEGNYSIITYSYDPEGYSVKLDLKYFENFNLLRHQQSIYENDVNGNRISELSQEWVENNWQNIMLIGNTYDNHNNVLSTVTSTWFNAQWQYLSSQEFAYNSQDYRTKLDYYDWDGNEWILRSNLIYTYEPDNFLSTSVYRQYDIVWGQISADSIRYYPGEPLALEEITGSNDLIIYPNPGRGVFTLNSSLPIDEMEVFNLAGERIVNAAPKRNGKVNIDLSNQAKGVYIVRTRSSNRVGVEKIVLK